MYNLKKQFFVLVIAAFVLAGIGGCKKEAGNAPENLPGPYIKTIAYLGAGNDRTDTFYYDDKYRLSLIVSSAGDSTAYQYALGAVTETSSGPNQHGVKAYLLNNDGYVRNCSDGRKFTYYRGYVITIDDKTLGQKFNFGYENSNLASKVMADASGTHTASYSYYQDKINTTGNRNCGRAFLGQQNFNVVSEEVSYFNGTTTIVNYLYEFDQQARVTKQTATGSPSQVLEFSYY